MQFGSRIWKAAKILGLVLIGDVLFTGQLVAQSTTASPPDQLGQVSETVPRLQSQFPQLKDFDAGSTPVTFTSPAERGSTDWEFVLVKLTVLVLAILVWIRCLNQAASEEEENDAQLNWNRRLFGIGLAGILIAVFIPPYAVGMILLVVSIVVPYWGYMRWHNQRSNDPHARLSWKRPFSRNIVFKPVAHSANAALLSGETLGGHGSVIRIVGKSPRAENDPWGFSRGAQKSPSFQYVLALIDHAVSTRTTDLHINTKSHNIEIRKRIDGSLISLGELPLELGRSLINVFKIMGDLNIADRKRSQDGSFLADVDGRRLSFRVSSQATHLGEKLSIRILDPVKTFSDLASLGLNGRTLERFTTQLEASHGLVLIVGATGAGKSTTACAALQSLDSANRNIVSIEDPIEYQIPSVDQIEVNYRAGQTFASALRSVLRLDADIILIGEIRDEETAEIACQAAQTGQLVIATMHAGNSVAGVARLAELGNDMQSVAGNLKAVLAQTLVRKLCPHCRRAYQPAQAELEQWEIQERDVQFFRPPDNEEASCPQCDGRGFLRRTGVYELLEVTPEIRDLIRQRAPESSLELAARKSGLPTMHQEALRLVQAGVISPNELRRVFGVQ